MSSQFMFAAIADDDTGASDLAGMFADQGVAVVLVLDASDPGALQRWTSNARGVVLATAARALPAADARARTAQALLVARSLNPRIYLLKYCSTFDSTEKGNIGPTIDTAMSLLETRFTIALPALPVNGRTTYCGYHFVKGQLLSDSPMRNHPLNPMANPNLVDFLARQTSRRVGLTPYPVVAAGADSIRQHWKHLEDTGVEVSIIDCLDDRQAAGIAEASCDLRLATGGSAFGTHLPAAWCRRGWLGDQPLPPLRVDTGGIGRLVVAGSCSTATTRQNQEIAGQGAVVIECDPIGLVDKRSNPELGSFVQNLALDATVLFKTRSTPADLSRSWEWAAAHGMTAAEFGLKLAESMADIVRQVLDLIQPRILVSAGGETSSALCRALKIRAFEVGRSIEPGVPLCVPAEGHRLPVALKSGNFGSPDFYAKAFAAANAAI